MKVLLDGVVLTSLRDDDGDGRFTGNFTYDPTTSTASAASATSNTLRFDIINGGVEQSFDLSVEPLVAGTVRDAFSQQPPTNAAVTALGASGSAYATGAFNPWPDAALGQPNPQMTNADGRYSFYVPGSVNRRAAGGISILSLMGHCGHERPAGARCCSDARDTGNGRLHHLHD